MQQNWQQQQQQQGYGGGYGSGGNSFMQAQPTGFQQPMQTGYGQPQPRPMTNFTGGSSGGNMSFLNQPPSFGGGGLNPQMTGYPGGGASGLMSQQTGYGGLNAQPTGYGGGLMSQPTGMGGGFGGLRAQPTGVQDPRLQSMMQTFMPSNLSQPFTSSGVPQFNAPPQHQPLTQTFQSLLQNPSVKTPKVPWTLSRQEKKDYDQIFRVWEKGDGFISGETAREVFGQSGLGQDDLMKIWTLSDIDNRGKLNLPEFHVAMGLIYRALNGNEIPEQLPAELIPSSMRDIDTTVNFMRDLLKHEASTRSDTSSPALGSSAAYGGHGPRDATAYKHDDSRSNSGTYKPSSRHLDRKAVRYAGEESDADIKDIRRQLQNTSAMLDSSNNDYARKSEEDEQLEQEIDDLKYRVKRLQEDIDYVSKGRRSADKDEERRKLERELLFLMHEKLPELERRQAQREDEKRMDDRAGNRARDKRNQTHGRYDDRDDRNGDRDWLRGTYDRDRRDSRDSRDRDYDRGYGRDSRDQSRDRRYDDYDRDRRDDRRDRDDYRPRTPPASRTPPPAPPPAPAAVAPPAAPPPKPTAPDPKKMTPEERTAFIRAQAQARIQDRLKALGVEPATEPSLVDKSTEERLAAEKLEAENKAKEADEEQKKREEARHARLAGTSSPAPPKDTPSAPPTPKSILKTGAKAGPPPPPASRAKQPPAPPAPRSTAAAKVPEPPAEDPEEAEFKRREEAIAKAKEERRKRLEQLEKEEADEAKRESDAALANKAKSAAATPSTPPPPPPPPAPAMPAPSPGGYNPFRKPGGGGSGAPAATPAAGGGFNPFFKPQAATPAAAEPTSNESTSAPPPPPPPPPAPPAPAPSAPAFTTRSAAADDEWEKIEERGDDSDSSSDDDDYATSRDHRRNLASALFGGISGGSPTTASRPGSTAPSSAKPTSAALQSLGGGDPNAGRGALLSAIQGGASLRKTKTVVKGETTGKVIGDAAPPSHINLEAQPRESTGTADHTAFSASPEPTSVAETGGFESDFAPRGANRGSVDWYEGLAADSLGPGPAASHGDTSVLEPTAEEDEEDEKDARGPPGPAINVQGEDTDEFDMATSLRVRSLYPYEGQRDVDLSFKEDIVLVAHPAKDASSPWWYGIMVDGGGKGWFPHSYVEEIKPVKAKATYAYTGNSDEELPFAEGDILDIVDRSDENWWKAEKAGVIFIVPAAYLEIEARTDKGAPSLPSAPEPSTSHAVPKALPSPNLLSPTDPVPKPPGSARSRSSTITSVDEGEYSSDSDSVLSWWSSDEDDSDASVDSGKEAERKKRELERQKILSMAGLKLRRDAPAPPPSRASGSNKVDRKPTIGRRRPAPAAPVKRRQAPAVPLSSHDEASESVVTPLASDQDDPMVETAVQDPEAATLDAYARYEQFLSSSLSSKPPARPTPAPITRVPSRPQSSGRDSPQGLGTAPTSPRHSSSSIPTTSLISGTSGGGSGGGRLSTFFSKMKTGANTPTERRHTPVISGPISKVELPNEGPEHEQEAEIGKTWSSLVDQGVLESMGDRERKRQEAIFEFIATEAAYNRDLQLIVEVFYASILHRKILDDKALTVIFANIEDILLANTSFLSSLEQRQKSCRLYVDVIGDILEDCMPSMAVYTPYCVNQHQAGKLLQSLRQSDPKLQAHLQDIRENNPAVRGLDLSSYLLIPMQRITRYPLLLKQIIHYTAPDQDLYPVQNALHIVENVVGTINENVREVEMHERLKELSEHLWIGGEGRLDLTAPTSHQGPRRLLKESTVTKAKSGRKLTMVLCNDILVLIDDGNLYRMPVPLFELTVRRARDESGIVLKVDHSRGGDTIGLKASNGRDAKEWMGVLEQARLDSIDARKGGSRRKMDDGTGMSFEF
ncbi:hypothetical protein BD324DRAFT_627945 [Kockovaella imperatae]|uniref:Actin cytoskeleton-regulatory complex protein PAN1 n=1 Tax=Kockovaella imperatae TaxID=4999 RepID=A0A1Y1UDV2_9TREE|nr:hypothetical protein BD324DRAFT_627945 [Kockovaella imperatae]ORX36220.1 hypothetical protein BD324DRAFT_627945 [Kockovaella imperatae]